MTMKNESIQKWAKRNKIDLIIEDKNNCRIYIFKDKLLFDEFIKKHDPSIFQKNFCEGQLGKPWTEK